MNPVTLQTLMGKRFPQQMWLVDTLIPASAITIISAPPKSYKTWVLLGIALSVARGEPLFGRFKTFQGRVLIIDEESGERLLHQRLVMLEATPELPVYFLSFQGFVLSQKSVKTVLETCKQHSITVIIIDSLIRVHKADENSAGEMAAVFAHLRHFTEQGITVIVTQHNRKPGQNSSAGNSNDMRGSSDILAAVDCHIAVVRKDKQVTFHQTKQRYAEEINPVEVSVVLDGDSFRFEYTGSIPKEDKDKALQDSVISLFGKHDELCQKDILQLLKKDSVETNEHTLRKILSAMVKGGVLTISHGQGNTKYYSVSELISHE